VHERPAASTSSSAAGGGPGRERLLLTAAAALLGGLVLGGLAATGVSPVLLAAGVLAPAVLVGTIVRPSVGLLVLTFIVYTHLSDVAVAFHGTPSVLQPYLLLLLIGLAAHAVADGALPSGLGLPTALLAAYAAVLGAGIFHAGDPDAAWFVLNVFLRDAVVVLLVVALLRTSRDLRAMVWVLVLSGGALAALGAFQYVTGSFGSSFGGFAQAGVKNIAEGNDDWRLSGPIADPNHWAQALIVVVPLALGRLRGSRSSWGRAVGGVALAATVVGIVLTFSRGALVAMAVLLVVALLLRRPPTWSIAVAGAGLLLALPFLPGGYVDRLGSLAQAVPGVGGEGSSDEASLSSRLSAALAARDMALDNPVLGVGPGQFPIRYREYSLGLGVPNSERGVEPHNMYLEVAAETGYLGLLAWGALACTALWRLVRARRRLRAAGERFEADLVEDLGLALGGYLLSGLFVHNAYPRLYWLLIGAALAVPVVVRSVLAHRPAAHPVLDPGYGVSSAGAVDARG
jgi:putative inorganic carbon (HCO3(-)) transporter